MPTTPAITPMGSPRLKGAAERPLWRDALVGLAILVALYVGTQLLNSSNSGTNGEGPSATQRLANAGTPPPQWTLNDLNGTPVSLASLKGNVVLLDFWATWCGPCRQLMAAELKPLYEKYKDKGLVIVGIGTNWNRETPETQKAFADHHGYTWPMVFDANGQVTRQYGVRGIPFCVLIDRDGNTVAAGNGFELAGLVQQYCSAHCK